MSNTIPPGTRMRFLQAVAPKGWAVVTRYKNYIVCEKLPDEDQLEFEFRRAS